MSDGNEMKEALDKAAASSDPAVRNMALRYREAQRELEQYESFFNLYKQGVKLNGTAPVARSVAPRAIATRTASTPRSDRVDTFGNAIQALLVGTGHPMKLNEIYTSYQQNHPDDQTTIETFRQRLVKRRESITLIRGHGYWWAAAPLPETSSDA